MGKKGRARKLPNSSFGSHTPISLREEATRKVQTKTGYNFKSILKLEHLKKLAVWASNEAYIPSLGTFYGQHLATVGEAMGLPPDPSLITCQRCETVFHPGFNCTIRIEKDIAKGRRGSKFVKDVAGSLEEKRRKRNALASTKATEPGSMSAQPNAQKSMGTSSKRRRKSWTSLKEIAQGSEHDQSGVANLKIPFFL